MTPYIPNNVSTDRERNLLQELYRAFLAVDNREDAQIADMINGDTITNSESDDPEALLEHSVMSDRMKKSIAKHRRSIKRQKQRHSKTCG